MLKNLTHYIYNILLPLILFGMSGMAVANRPSSAQPALFNQLTKADGLAGESVTTIVTDHIGLVWIATSNGVNCYNGRTMQTFEVPCTEGSRNYTYDICEGDDHAIYIATAEGAFVLRRGNDRFERILPEIGKVETILRTDGHLYVGNRDGLWVYDGTNLTNVKVGTTPMGIENSVRDIKRGDDGLIWFLSRYAINTYDPRSRTHATHILTGDMPEGTAFNHLALLGKRFLIASKTNGLFVYDPHASRKVEAVDGVGNVINSIYVTSKGKVCVGTDGAGAFVLDGQSLQIEEHFYTEAADDYHRLPTDGAYCYYRDTNDVDWFGFFRLGILHSWHVTPLFQTYTCGSFTTQGMEVRSYLRDGQQMVIGTNKGLFVADEEAQTVRSVPVSQLDGMHILTSIVRFGGAYYVGSYDAGVRRIDAKTLQVSRVAADELLTSATVTRLYVSPRNRLWMLTGEGVYILDSAGRLTRYTENNSKIPGGTARSLLFDPKGNAWITFPDGLTVYDAATHNFESSNFPAGFFNNEPKLNVTKGADGQLILFNSSDIYRTTWDMKTFGLLNLPLANSHETCYDLLFDGQTYWYATERGLAAINADSLHVQHFGFAEGLNSMFINSSSLSTDGQRLWLGTYSGLMSANLDSIRQWQNQTTHHPMLYGINIASNPLRWDEEREVNEQKHIDIRWNFTSQPLTMSITLPDFSRSAGRQFEYRIDGGRWQFASDGVPAEVRGLLPGSHKLDIRLSGADNTQTTYTLSVAPSWLAVLELLLIVLLLVVTFNWRKLRVERKTLISERNEIQDALLEIETIATAAMENEEKAVEAQSVVEKEKYEKVRINEDECRQIMDQVRTYIEQERLYVNPDLKMKEVADHLHISSSKLSQVFNVYLGENYYEFINRYRLEEFKRLIAEGQHKRFTITALSEQCGFKKSSFFATFRRVEGVTPTEYLKKVKAV